MELQELDCEPFYHGYGEQFSNAELVLAIWTLPINDIYGNNADIPFYITPGSGLLLLGNNITSRSNMLGSHNLTVVPEDTGVADLQVVLPTHTTKELRTHVFVVPSRISSFHSFFSSYKYASQESFMSTGRSALNANNLKSSTVAKKFAAKLHLYTHMTRADMQELWKRAGILTPVLSQALHSAYDRCISCTSTGRPAASRKVSFKKLLYTFNDHIQVDFFFIKSFKNTPIQHIVDVASGFSATDILPSRDMDVAAKIIECKWIHQYGPPQRFSADPEFDNVSVKDVLRRHFIDFEPRPARRHNKVGHVERKNDVIRLLVSRVDKDSQNAMQITGQVEPATFLL